MSGSDTARPASRRPRSNLFAVPAVVRTALAGIRVLRSLALSTSLTASLVNLRRGDHGELLGAADGVVPDGVTTFDDATPGVANLDPALLAALRRAADGAADDGVVFLVDSGWRSRRYQEQLFRRALSKCGSVEEASRWVATPDTSAHVSGEAVDIGQSDAVVWLSEHGAGYGLCQIYRNEPWHYELRPEAVGGACPPMYDDPTQDPRMRCVTRMLGGSPSELIDFRPGHMVPDAVGEG